MRGQNGNFPTLTEATADERLGIAWFNSPSRQARAYWLNKAGSARPVDAWRAFKAANQDAA